MPFFMFFIIKERKRYVKFALHQIKSAINFVFSEESLTFALNLLETELSHAVKNGLKAQKLLAQGIALGIIAASKAPCKGKSLTNCQVL